MGLLNTLQTDPQAGIILIIALVFSLSFHEFAHAYVAYRLGDNTAAYQGRLTLNPLVHLDPVGSLMLLFVGFGYAKPVPVNPFNLNNPKKDIIKGAAAGPISNLILSFMGLFTLYLLAVIYPSIAMILSLRELVAPEVTAVFKAVSTSALISAAVGGAAVM